MTTLRDILKDYGQEMLELAAEFETQIADGYKLTTDDYQQRKDDLIEEYCDLIKERIVG